MCADNNLGDEDEGVMILRKIASDTQQQRLARRKQYQQAITLILLSHQSSEESAFQVLPLEMVHMIIRFVLDDMPAATTLKLLY